MIKKSCKNCEELKQQIKNLIDKYSSNWFYCECKDKYGNDVRFLLKQVEDDLIDCWEARK